MSAQASSIYHIATSSELPAHQRYEQWLMPMLSCCEAAAPTERQRRDFRGQVLSLTAGASELHDMQSDSFDGLYSKRSIRRGGADELALVYLRQGHVLTRYEDDADLTTEAGQFLLIDARSPQHTRFLAPHFVQVNLPRTELQAMLGRASLSQLSRAVSQSGLAGLLASQLGQYREISDKLTSRERRGFLEATEALAASVVESVCLQGGLRDGGQHRLQGLYAAAQQHIRANLGDPALNGATIAAALGCSRATLYRAFAEHGLGVAEFLRNLRMKKAHQMLQKASTHYSIAEVAAHCGFMDHASFSRLFRQHYGVSPSDVRQGHRSPS